MEQFLKLISAFNKTAPASSLGVAIAMSLIIFLPEPVVLKLGIFEFRETNKGFIGWAFILTYSYLAALLLWEIKNYLKSKYIKHHVTKKYQSKLHELTSLEKGYLSEFMSGENTLHLEMEDGVIGGLSAKEIVYRSSDVFDPIEGIPYNLQPWARKYLEQNPILLEGAKHREIESY